MTHKVDRPFRGQDLIKGPSIFVLKVDEPSQG